MKYIDLTHTFKEKMPVYPGDPESSLKQIAFVEKEGFNEFQVKTSMHVGTHMDAPFHMLADGKKLSDFTPERFFGKGWLIDARGKNIDVNLLEGKKILKGDIVLIMTGFSEKFGDSEYYKSYPEMSKDFAAKIIELGVGMVGMDTPSPDYPPFPIHKLLMRNDVLIIENLTNLKSLIGQGDFTVTALPTKFESEAAPVRVVAQV
jgi:kynurenine formamidase